MTSGFQDRCFHSLRSGTLEDVQARRKKSGEDFLVEEGMHHKRASFWQGLASFELQPSNYSVRLSAGLVQTLRIF